MEYAPGLTAIQFVDDVPTAQTDADTGLTLINRQLWASLDTAQRYFLLLHEQAHLTGQTEDELTADRLAIAQFLRRFPGNPAPLTLLQRVLNPNLARARLDQCRKLIMASC
ncbi:hypothetical protein ACAW74_18195 [Fibrella sp. WM1]|uniref:hypothetical protein n=1 Tax=Fibrella musci TaxID=3242485 RepID=UPI003522F8AB